MSFQVGSREMPEWLKGRSRALATWNSVVASWVRIPVSRLPA